MRLNHRKKPTGFTLIEMVGVLAVIAILAAILVPKIFAAIEESRYNNAIASVNGVKAATMNYFAQKGAFTVDAGATKFDNRLISNGDLERPFATRIGSGWECNALAAADAGVADGNRFSKLDGTANVKASGIVIQCKIAGVPGADAWELSKRIDGTAMSAANAAALDDLGRVIYDEPDADTGLTDVYVYIAHK